ncbi:UDP-N-acetylmuramate dehydrogenase [gamma proteobacterium HdN1]|nr:UDP-N-acetylmuramate dehydrogenase [gamma proteobacterium HdN1]
MDLGIGKLYENADLRQCSRWRIGGRASLLVEPSSIDALASLKQFLCAKQIPHLVIGDGANLLFDDAGVEGVVIRLGKSLSGIRVDGDLLSVDAGVWVPRLAHASLLAGLTGLEHIVGIPGTVGGLVCMNGGSQRRGIGDNVVDVTAVDGNGDVIRLDASECGFAYRTSRFQSGLTVAACTLRLQPGDKKAIRREMLEILHSRRTRFPLKLPNCGSVFVSNPAMYDLVGPPGKAIELVGLKGVRRGGARVSPQHANFIVNEGNASSTDVLTLIADIRSEVHKQTGYWMESEVRYVAPNCSIFPAHCAKEMT